MKHLVSVIFLLATTIVFPSDNTTETNPSNYRLWYQQPAKTWMEALPIGNGRLGAMVFGNPVNERIQLNEDSLWPGGADWDDSKGTPDDLATIRRLIKKGKIEEADRLIVEKFSNKSIIRSHQTLGDLHLNYKHKNITDYKRYLDLNTALAITQYKNDGHPFKQTIFSSPVHDIIIIKLESKHPEGLQCKLTLSRPKDKDFETVKNKTLSKGILIMSGMVTQLGGKFNSKPYPIKQGVRFEARIEVDSKNGKVSAKNNSISINGGKEAIIYLAANTSFYHKNFQKITKNKIVSSKKKNYKQLVNDHIREHQRLFNRVKLNLGKKNNDHIPTDQRLLLMKKGAIDLHMDTLLFHFGRYLLISCSRPGTNPANLQGLWNEHIQAPWNADYHLNINLQMNYWPAEICNLSECHLPLFNFIDRLIKRGKITAREQYDCSGFVVHHATDLWAPAFMRASTSYWGSWIHGGGWLMQHMWEHYRFTQDKKFLRDRLYPALKECTEFYNDWLSVYDADGTLASSPSTSPENSYTLPNNKTAAVAAGSAMDQQIISEVFDNFLSSAKILGVSDNFTNTISQKRKKLKSGLIIGSDGRILEWNKEYPEPEKGHRHMSHLYGLHPGDDITRNKTPKLFKAARKTLDYRLAHGGAGTGWSRAWLINFSARLLDGKMAYEHIQLLFKNSIFPNLFDAHPPFQIDGNFGYTAGVAEMLLQSHAGFIDILPALPIEWPNGKVIGLRARGNYEVSIRWKNGKVARLEIKSFDKTPCKVKVNSKILNLKFSKNSVNIVTFTD